MESVGVKDPRDAHDKQSHLFVALQEIVTFTVYQRLTAHCARIDASHSIKERG